jgi:hypothetical protein
MKRTLYLVAGVMTLAVIIAAAWRPQPAHASEVWCWDDPVLMIDGVPIALNLGIRTAHLDAVEEIDIAVEVPRGTPIRVLYIERGSITPKVRFNYPADSDFDQPVGPINSARVTVTVKAAHTFDYAVNILNVGDTTIAPRTDTAYTNRQYVGWIQLRDS